MSVAHSAVEHFTHIVRRVARLYIEPADDGSTAALLIESLDGTRTVLQLRAPTSRTRDLDPPIPNQAVTK